MRRRHFALVSCSRHSQVPRTRTRTRTPLDSNRKRIHFSFSFQFSASLGDCLLTLHLSPHLPLPPFSVRQTSTNLWHCRANKKKKRKITKIQAAKWRSFFVLLFLWKFLTLFARQPPTPPTSRDGGDHPPPAKALLTPSALAWPLLSRFYRCSIYLLAFLGCTARNEGFNLKFNNKIN